MENQSEPQHDVSAVLTSLSRGYGATAARLTPDQKVGSSNLSGLILNRYKRVTWPFTKAKCSVHRHDSLAERSKAVAQGAIP